MGLETHNPPVLRDVMPGCKEAFVEEVVVEEAVVVLIEYPGMWVGLAVVCQPVGGMVARYIFLPWAPVDHWCYGVEEFDFVANCVYKCA